MKTETKAKPILKWAGGKRQLLPELIKRLPKDYNNFHEPFFGGGALFFAVADNAKSRKYFLSDVNPKLISLYNVVRQGSQKLIAELKKLKHSEEEFYRLRALDESKLTPLEAAARLIYLNRTCFNGLYRENLSGQFNVPFGRYQNPKICDEANLNLVSKQLQKAVLKSQDFEKASRQFAKGDFVYFDPPYQPLSATSAFTAYSKNIFGEKEQVRLAELFKKLKSRGIKAMLSNSSAPLIFKIYKSFKIEEVQAKRSINSKSSARGSIAEVIVTNY